MRRFFYWALGGILLAGAGSVSASESGERELEAKLLNRHLNLSGVQRYSRARQSWQPLRDDGAQIRVVNLWSKSCLPCLAELPALRTLAAEWQRRDRHNVEFVFVADPPEQTSREDVTSFWASPFADGLAKACPSPGGTTMPHGGTPSCLLELPEQEPARSESEDLTRSLGGVLIRPVTLILDAQGTIRQVFAGSIKGKHELVSGAIERLSQAVKPSVGSRHSSAARGLDGR